jgi:hypothetical protein
VWPALALLALELSGCARSINSAIEACYAHGDTSLDVEAHGRVLGRNPPSENARIGLANETDVFLVNLDVPDVALSGYPLTIDDHHGIAREMDLKYGYYLVLRGELVCRTEQTKYLAKYVFVPLSIREVPLSQSEKASGV